MKSRTRNGSSSSLHHSLFPSRNLEVIGSTLESCRGTHGPYCSSKGESFSRRKESWQDLAWPCGFNFLKNGGDKHGFDTPDQDTRQAREKTDKIGETDKGQIKASSATYCKKAIKHVKIWIIQYQQSAFAARSGFIKYMSPLLYLSEINFGINRMYIQGLF